MEFTFLTLKKMISFLYNKMMTYQISKLKDCNVKNASSKQILDKWHDYFKKQKLPESSISYCACYNCGEIYDLGNPEEDCVVCLEPTVIKKYEDQSLEEFRETLKLKKIIYL